MKRNLKEKNSFVCIAILLLMLIGKYESFSQSKSDRNPTLQYNYIPKQDSTKFTYYKFRTESPNRHLNIIPNPNNLCSPITYRKGTLFLILEINDEDYRLGDITNSARLVCSVKVASGLIIGSFDLEVKMSNKKQRAIVSLDVTADLAGNTEFYIDNLNFTLDPPNDVNFEKNLFIEFFINVDSFFDINDNTLSTVSPINGATFYNGKDVEFSWQLENECKFPNYQIQIMRLYDVNRNPAYFKCSEFDWKNSLTLETGNSLTSFKIRPAEGSGYYVWRVRPIGNIKPDGIANVENLGAWTSIVVGNSVESYNLSAYDKNNVFAFNTSSSLTGEIFYYEDNDYDKNFVFNRVFAEGDDGLSVNENFQFVDNLLNIRQEQTHISSEDATLVKNYYYDKAGRNTLSSLPIPFKTIEKVNDAYVDKAHFAYQSSLLKNAAGSSYSNSDFDVANMSSTEPVKANPPIPENPGDLSYYYSGKQSTLYPLDNSFVPYAGKKAQIPSAPNVDILIYPFSRTIYTSDGTNRIKEQASAGGYQYDSDSRTVKYYYSSVCDDELIPLFGFEAPNANKVHKQIVVDQHGVANITYLLSNGKVLATCLDKNSELITNSKLPENVLGLSTSSEIDDEQLLSKEMTDVFKEVVESNEKSIASKLYSFSTLTNVTFSYMVNQSKIDLADEFCVPYCPDCDYKVTLNIRNAESGAIINTNPNTMIVPNVPANGSINTDCNQAQPPQTLSITINLSPGSYIFERIIEYNNVFSAGGTNDLEQITLIEEKLKTDISLYYNSFFSGLFAILDDMKSASNDLNDLKAYVNSNPDYTISNNEVTCHFADPCYDDFYFSFQECEDCVEGSVNMDFETILKDKIDELRAKFSIVGYNPNDNIYEYFYKGDGNSKYFIPAQTGFTFNDIIDNMMNDPVIGYTQCQLYKCWMAIVNSFEFIGLSKKSNSNDYEFNKDFNIVEYFLECVGKHYEGMNIASGFYPAYSTTDRGYLSHPYKCFKLTYDLNDRIDIIRARCYLDYIYSNDDLHELYRNMNVKTVNGSQRVGEYSMDDFNTCQEFLDLIGKTIEDNCEDRLQSFVEQLIQEYNILNIRVKGQLIKYDNVLNKFIPISNSEADLLDAQTNSDIPYSDVVCKAWAMVNECKQFKNEVTFQCLADGSIDTGGDFDDNIEKLKKYLINPIVLKLKVDGVCPVGFTSIASSLLNSKFDRAKYVSQEMNNILQNKILKNLDRLNPSSNSDVCKVYENFTILNNAYENITGEQSCFKWLINLPPQDKLPTLLSSGSGSGTSSCEYLPRDWEHHFFYPQILSFFDYYCGAIVGDDIWQWENNYFGKVVASERFIISDFTKILKKSTINNSNKDGSTIDRAIDIYDMGNYYDGMLHDIYNWVYMFLPDNYSKSDIIKYEIVSYGNQLIMQHTKLNSYGTPTDTMYFRLCCLDTISCAVDVCYKIDTIPNSIDGKFKPPHKISCDEKIANDILKQINDYIANDIAYRVSKIKEKYQKKCIDERHDITQLSYWINYYHYTLYYYDRAGNLVRTVSPKGVDLSKADRLSKPLHASETFYEYNSLGNLISSSNPEYLEFAPSPLVKPDRFSDSIFYNFKLQPRVSRVPKQVFDKRVNPNSLYKYSYTNFDSLGRVIESGEFQIPHEENNDKTTIPDNFPTMALQQPNSDAYPPNSWKKMIVKTFYSVAAVNLPDPYTTPAQRNLENRISYTFRDEDGDHLTTFDRSWSYYSYDAHGNVEWVIHVLPYGVTTKVEYDYDLISGKVKNIVHNKSRPNQMHYKFFYDADNRLKEVLTSKKGLLWEKDAAYKYYLHGPLKRIEIGNDLIQGLDFVYTINGWLKGLNNYSVDREESDMGKDGGILPSLLPSSLPMDEFGYSLGYFENDYWCDGNLGFNEHQLFKKLAQEKPYNMYNGNIATIDFSFGEATNNKLANLQTSKLYGFAYKYDILGRLKETEYAYDSQDLRNSIWFFPPSKSYQEQFNYDPNGNILSLSRKNKDVFIDNFQYNYKTAVNSPSSIHNTSNRLYSLNENATYFAPPYNDISPLSPPPLPLIIDYKYDISGNLIQDLNSEINDIEWTADGKIKKILKPTATILFYYDAAGNRTCKVDVRSRVEYYLRDANGQLLEILEFDIVNLGTPGDLPPEWVATAGGVVVTHPPSIMAKGGKNEKGGRKDAVKGEQLLSGNSLAWDFYGNTSDLVSLNLPDYPANPFLSTINTNLGNLSYRSNQWFVYGSESHGRFATIRSDDYHRGYSYNLDVPEATTEARYLGTKFYELKDHLGNVRVVLKDWKLNPGNTGLPPFTAQPEEVFNYYAFGMLIPGFFSNSSPDYRFGFNGMLRDDDVRDKNAPISAEEGLGNSYSTEFRGYDPRRGQWLSIDPLAYEFPWSSPYVAMGNNPVIMVDPDGDWFWAANNNKTLFNYIMKDNSTQTVIKTMDKKSLEETNKKLNSLVDVWSDPKSPHYAPNIADFVKNENNRIPVLIGTIGDISVGGYCRQGAIFSNDIKNPIVIKLDMNPGTVIHETIHYKGGSEFDAYSGQIAAGYTTSFIPNLLSGSIIDFQLMNDKNNNDLINLRGHLLTSIENYVKTNNISIELTDKNGEKIYNNYYQVMKIRGQEIVGSTKKTEEKKK